MADMGGNVVDTRKAKESVDAKVERISARIQAQRAAIEAELQRIPCLRDSALSRAHLGGKVVHVATDRIHWTANAPEGEPPFDAAGYGCSARAAYRPRRVDPDGIARFVDTGEKCK